MNYLLDTNIVSHVIRGDVPEITEKIKSIDVSKISVSVITYAEIYYGLERKGNPVELKDLVNEFFEVIDILPFDVTEAISYASLRTACQKEGITLESMDLLIAAHALALQSHANKDYVLITRDKVFSKIPNSVGLKYESW